MGSREEVGSGPDGVGAEADSARDQTDRELENAILRLLDTRAPSASICPSDVVRNSGDQNWRGSMEDVRRAARRLEAAGEVEITQGGSVVDPHAVRGPIRIRRPRAG